MMYQGALITGYSESGSDTTAANTAYNTYVSNSGGYAPSLIHQGYSWKGSGGAYNNFPLTDVTRFRAKGAIPVVSFQPGQSGIVANAAFSYDAICAGDHDAFLTTWAQAAASWNHPLIVRLAHEFNAGTYFTWLQGHSYNTGGVNSYADMWRHVVNLMRPIAPKITWFWCCNTTSATYPLNSSNWPGKAYVDYAGFDTYFGRQQYFDSAETVVQCWQPTYNEVASVCEGVPQLVGETGVEEYATIPLEKKNWYIELWAQAWTTTFPLIKGVVYYNRMHDTAQPVKGNWLISTTQNAIDGYSTLATQSSIWATNTFASFETAGSIKPLDYVSPTLGFQKVTASPRLRMRLKKGTGV